MRNGAFSALWRLMLPFGALFPGLLLIMLGLSGPVVSAFIGTSSDALGLLRACRNWCLLLCVISIAALLLLILAAVFSIRWTMRREETRGMTGHVIKISLVSFFVEAILLGALLYTGPVLSVIADAQADIRQIESGETETALLWMYPGSALTHLPGPYSGEHPSPLTKYYAADDSLQSWDPYLFPNSLHFAPEPGPGGVYASSKSKEWNEENVPRYQVVYTSRLRFVVSAERADD